MKFYGIKIIGSKKFIRQTKEALSLIEQKSKKDFNKIIKYLKTIKQSRQSGMVLSESRFNVGTRTAFSSLEWYASTIVHDVHHYYLHNIRNFLWKPKNFKEHERLCLKEQISFLNKIKAPKYLAKHCREIFKKEYWTTAFKKKHGKW